MPKLKYKNQMGLNELVIPDDDDDDDDNDDELSLWYGWQTKPV